MRKDCQVEINKKVDAICEEIYILDMHERASEWKRLRTCVQIKPVLYPQKL